MVFGLFLAIRCFFAALFGRPLPAAASELGSAKSADALPEKTAEASGATKPAVSHVDAIQLLALFQKEGRLLDFLRESIDDYDDAQIGAAVRNIHRDCGKVLNEHLRLEPVLPGEEDQPVTLEENFDPARVRLIGNVTGQPPFSGVLRHHGWRATGLTLPELGESADPSLIAPAEVELS